MDTETPSLVKVKKWPHHRLETNFSEKRFDIVAAKFNACPEFALYSVGQMVLPSGKKESTIVRELGHGFDFGVGGNIEAWDNKGFGRANEGKSKFTVKS